MVTASTLVAVTVDGLAAGVVFALLGVSITLVFGLGEVLNLAVGIFAVLTVLVATTLLRSGIPLPAALLGGLVFVAVVGLAVDRSLLRSVYRSTGEERILLGIFVTLGLAVFLQGTLVNLYPSRYSIPLEVGSVTVGPVAITGSSMATIAVGSVVLVAVFAFLRYTYIGKATRTLFQDERGAKLVGVRPGRMRTVIFVVSTLVAGVGGVVFGWGATVTVASGFQLATFGMIVSIVGGVRSVVGAVGAGLLLGTVSQYANFFVGSYLSTVILFTTAVVVILIKPEVLG